MNTFVINSLKICTLVGSSAIVSQAATITNWGYPPPGGVTFMSSGVGPGNVGGKTWDFSSFDSGAYGQMWWSLDQNYPAVSMNSSGPPPVLSFSSFTPTEAVWSGSSNFTTGIPSPVTQSVNTRFRAVLNGGATWIDSSTLSAIDNTFVPPQPVSTEVLGDFSADFYAEVFWSGSWQPINVVFDAESTSPNDGTQVSFGSTFFATAPTSAVPEPNSALGVIAFLGLGLSFRKRRS